MRMLRAPNCERAPKPRTEIRVSCDGFVRLAKVTPGRSASDCSTSVCVRPGTSESGRVLLIAKGKSSVDRPTSRVTVTTGGRRRGKVSCAASGKTAATTAVSPASHEKGAFTEFDPGVNRLNVPHGTDRYEDGHETKVCPRSRPDPLLT